MKQVIPFKKEILFKTKICEITSISLEHTLSLVEDDLLNGEFIISGDYKMTEGSINREKFLYKLPCEISLTKNYKKDNLVIDIDNFYYEVVNGEYLNVFIDVYIDGEVIPEVVGEVVKDSDNIVDNSDRLIESSDKLIESNDRVDELSIISEDDKEEAAKDIDNVNNNIVEIEKEKSKDMKINDTKNEIDIKESKIEDINIDNKDEESTFNIFNSNVDNSDNYVTYHVYIIKEDDNIDNIINKFKTTKDIISEYNDITNIKPGTKLIIPNNKDE